MQQTGNEWASTMYFSKQQNLYFMSPPNQGTTNRSSFTEYDRGSFLRAGLMPAGDTHTHPDYLPGVPDQFSALDRATEMSASATYPGYTGFLGLIDGSGNPAFYSLTPSGAVHSLGNPKNKSC